MALRDPLQTFGSLDSAPQSGLWTRRPETSSQSELFPAGGAPVGSALSVVGVLVVVGRVEWRVLGDLHFVPGDLFMLLGVSCWALYSWLLARPPASMKAPLRPAWDWAQFLFVQVLFGIGWALLGAGAEQAVAPQPTTWSPWIVALILYVAIGPLILAFRCWGIGVAQAGPTMAAFFSNLSPLFAAGLSMLLMGEAPQLPRGGLCAGAGRHRGVVAALRHAVQALVVI